MAVGPEAGEKLQGLETTDNEVVRSVAVRDEIEEPVRDEIEEPGVEWADVTRTLARSGHQNSVY